MKTRAAAVASEPGAVLAFTDKHVSTGPRPGVCRGAMAAASADRTTSTAFSRRSWERQDRRGQLKTRGSTTARRRHAPAVGLRGEFLRPADRRPCYLRTRGACLVDSHRQDPASCRCDGGRRVPSGLPDSASRSGGARIGSGAVHRSKTTCRTHWTPAGPDVRRKTERPRRDLREAEER